jgi:uncharacterized membrane protein YgcG
MAQQIAAFVSANAGAMDPSIMADQIKQEVRKKVFFCCLFLSLLDTKACRENVCVCVCVCVKFVVWRMLFTNSLTHICPRHAQYPHALGIGRRNILLHLREHVLLPNVRMASIIRSLIGLAETLRCTLQQIDEETGEVMVDIKNTELYLKVISQIHSVYRTEGSKMLFGGGGNSASSSGGGGGTHGNAAASSSS